MSEVSLSVFVVALAGGEALVGCLSRLIAQGTAPTVLLPAGERVETWHRQYAELGFHADEGMPIPRRRLKAVQTAGSEVVALLEDTTWPEAGWREAIETAFRDPALGALGGPVAVAATLPSRLRALGWTEYGSFAGAAVGAAAVVPGNNMAFRREALLAALEGDDTGLVEAAACQRLRAAGFAVQLAPGMAAAYAGPAPAQARLATRFRHGRLHGALRGRDHGRAGRLLLAARSPLVPPVMFARTLRQLRGSAVAADWQALSWAAVLHVAWAAGEAVGLLAGAGRSLEAWR